VLLCNEYPELSEGILSNSGVRGILAYLERVAETGENSTENLKHRFVRSSASKHLNLMTDKDSGKSHGKNPGTGSGEAKQGHTSSTDLLNQDGIDEDGGQTAARKDDRDCERERHTSTS
jgi:hypothetical protein